MTTKRKILLKTEVIRKRVVPNITKFRVSQTFIDTVCRFISLIIEKNCRSPTLKFKLGEFYHDGRRTNYYLNDYQTNCKTATRNLSRDWLTSYDLLFKSYGDFKSTCTFSKSKHFLRTVNSSLHMLKCGVMFTGQTHLSKGNFPFNLENTLSMATLNNALQNSLT